MLGFDTLSPMSHRHHTLHICNIDQLPLTLFEKATKWQVRLLLLRNIRIDIIRIGIVQAKHKLTSIKYIVQQYLTIFRSFGDFFRTSKKLKFYLGTIYGLIKVWKTNTTNPSLFPVPQYKIPLLRFPLCQLFGLLNSDSQR